MPVAVLIPAYQPPPSLVALARALGDAPPVARIVVVDDGSSPDFAGRFAEVAALPKVHVVRHASNRGKGAALKTGFAHVATAYPDLAGVVTADADGQHAADDVVLVGEAMARTGSIQLGARAVGASAPLRSRFGNALTRHALRLVTGLRLSDTQTGLRAIPMSRLGEFLELPNDGYDYEMDMLVTCARRGLPVSEVTIRTIYLDGNRSSHFDPIRDSLLIYYVLLRYLVSSLVSAVVDNVAFVLAYAATTNILAAQIVGRAGGASVNFWLNRNRVFFSREPGRSTLARYVALLLASGALSYGLIRALVAAGMGVLGAKILAESAIFFGNFALQRTLVFPPAGSARPPVSRR